MALEQFGIELLIKARDEASNAISSIANHLGAFGPLISKLGAGAAGPLGVIAAGVAAVGTATVLAGKQIADQVEQLDRMSQQTGVTAHDLQVLRTVMEDAGGSADSLTQPLQILSEAVSRQDPLLQALGITTDDVFEAFRQLADIIATTTDAGVRNEVMQRLLGRGGRQLVADMTAVSEAFDETEKQMEESGAIIRDDVMPAARDLDREMDTLGTHWKGIWTSMQTAAIPAATEIVKAINSMIEVTKKLPRTPGASRFGAFAGAGAGAGVTTPFTPSETEEEKNKKNAEAALKRAKEIEEAQKAAAAAAKAHAKEVAELADVMNISTTEAEKNLAVLKEFDRLQKAAAIDAKLKEAHFGPETGPEFKLPSEAEMRRLEEMTSGLDTAKQAADLLRGSIDAIPDSLGNMLRSWDDTLAVILSTVAIIDDAIGTILGSLTVGFADAIRGLFSSYQTAAGVILKLLSAIGDALIAVVARIAAALVTLGILRLLGALFNINTEGLARLAGVSFGGGGTSSNINGGGAGGRQIVQNNNRDFGFTVQIEAVDAKSVADMFESPTGAMRLQRMAQMATVPI